MYLERLLQPCHPELAFRAPLVLDRLWDTAACIWKQSRTELRQEGPLDCYAKLHLVPFLRNGGSVASAGGLCLDVRSFTGGCTFWLEKWAVRFNAITYEGRRKGERRYT